MKKVNRKNTDPIILQTENKGAVEKYTRKNLFLRHLYFLLTHQQLKTKHKTEKKAYKSHCTSCPDFFIDQLGHPKAIQDQKLSQS